MLQVIFPQVNTVWSQQHAQICLTATTVLILYRKVNCPNQEGLDKGCEKGASRQGGRGNWQKGTRQELCDWNPRHPPHSINSNTHAQMVHENPFMLQAGRGDDTVKEGGRYKGWMDE